MSIEQAIVARYPRNESLQQKFINFLVYCKDNNFFETETESRLCSKDDYVFWQSVSELQIAKSLSDRGLNPVRKQGGPDFLVSCGDKKVWIEVVCPTPAGIPSDWLSPENRKTFSMPHLEILLRWTSAIREKSEKWINKNLAGCYTTNKNVSENDAYVIAINSFLLRSGISNLNGISQLPFPVEAVFAVGPISVTLGRESGKVLDVNQVYRASISNSNMSKVDTSVFLNKSCSHISAIWGMDCGENTIANIKEHTVVVHNPFANEKIEQVWLPSSYDYICDFFGDDYVVNRINGSMLQDSVE
jgi:hypothetical protein